MPQSFKISIYDVEDYRDFLRLYISHCQSKNPQWTVTKWVQQLGLQSLASLNSLLSGRRQCGKGIEKSLLSFFSFPENEREFFRLLVLLSKLKPDEIAYPIIQKEISHRRQFRGKNSKSLLIAQFRSAPKNLSSIQAQLEIDAQKLANKFTPEDSVQELIVCTICLNYGDVGTEAGQT